MKTYINKLYSIPDAAKRAGITVDAVMTMIEMNIIKAEETYKYLFIRGNIIPALKGKWKIYQRELKLKAEAKAKNPLIQVPVTIMRMDKGE